MNNYSVENPNDLLNTQISKIEQANTDSEYQ